MAHQSDQRPPTDTLDEEAAELSLLSEDDLPEAIILGDASPDDLFARSASMGTNSSDIVPIEVDVDMDMDSDAEPSLSGLAPSTAEPPPGRRRPQGAKPAPGGPPSRKQSLGRLELTARAATSAAEDLATSRIRELERTNKSLEEQLHGLRRELQHRKAQFDTIGLPADAALPPDLLEVQRYITELFFAAQRGAELEERAAAPTDVHPDQARLQRELEQLQRERDQLNAELDQRSAQLRETARGRQELEVRLEAIKQARDGAIERVQQHKALSDNLQSRLDELTRELTRATPERGEPPEARAKLEAEHKLQGEQINRLTIALQELQAQSEAPTSTSDEHEADKRRLKEAQEQIDALLASLDAYEQRAQEAQEQTHEAETRAQQAETRAQQAEASTTEAQRLLAESQTRVEAAQEALLTLQEERDVEQADAQAQTLQLHDTLAEAEQLRAQLEEAVLLGETLQVQLVDLQQAELVLQEQLLALQEELDTVRGSIAHAEQLHAEHDELAKAYEELQRAHFERGAQIVDALKESERLRSQLDQAQEAQDTLRGEHARELASRDAELEQLHEVITRVREERDQLREELASIPPAPEPTHAEVLSVQVPPDKRRDDPILLSAQAVPDDLRDEIDAILGMDPPRRTAATDPLETLRERKWLHKKPTVDYTRIGGLDHRAGFLLTLVDGDVTLEDLIDLSGLHVRDAATLVIDLIEAGALCV